MRLRPSVKLKLKQIKRILIIYQGRMPTSPISKKIPLLYGHSLPAWYQGMGDGIWLLNNKQDVENIKVSGRTYLEVKNNAQFLNNTAFSILQATRTRISKTEYISCPSCGRTLFDLQETTAKIRSYTYHLKGVKISILGCIVNGPGEMDDADFGYVGSGPGKITLYKGKEVVKRNVDSEVAVSELINLLKESEVWIERES